MKSTQDIAYERVQSAFAEPYSVTEDTVRLLNNLLDIGSKAVRTKPVAATSGTKALPRRVTTKSKAPVKTAKTRPVTVAIHESAPIEVSSLEKKKRKRLATFAFNAALKVLSEAAKSKLSTTLEACSRPTSRAATDLSKPLKELSLNEAGRNVKGLAKVDSFHSVAQCAETALQCLRNLVDAEDGEDSTREGLDQGGLVLLDKLITLELAVAAEEQSRKLHDQYWKRRKATVPGAHVYARLTLQQEQTAGGHKFAISLQSQNLRLAILQEPNRAQLGLSDCVDPDKPGTPAWMVIQGHKDALIDAQTCGAQLRTISLAVSKLHSMVDKSCPAALRAESMRLAVLALRIKCMSWKHLKHDPDFERELWTPISKLMKKAQPAVMKNSTLRNVAQACLQSVQSTLTQFGIVSSPPKALLSICGVQDVVPLRRRAVASTSTTSEAEQFGILEGSVKALEAWKSDSKSATSAAENCIGVLGSRTESILSHQSLLLIITRLRKHAATAIDEIEKQKQPDTQDKSLQIILLRLIDVLICALYNAAASEFPTETLGKASNEAGKLLAYAKAIETVLSLESIRATQGPLQEQSHASLMTCVSLAAVVRDRLDIGGLSEGVRDFVQTVPLRVSHALWKRYLAQTEQAQPVSKRIILLTSAITAMESASRKSRRTALLGMKHEKLAELYAETEQYSQAQNSLAEAIDCQIAQDDVFETLDDQKVKAANTSDAQAISTLQAYLNKYVRLALEHNLSGPRGLWYYDDNQQHDFLRAFVMQHQILTATQSTSTLDPSQISGVLQIWEKLLAGEDSELCRLEFLSHLLGVLAKSKCINTSEAVANIKTLKALEDVCTRPIDGETGMQHTSLARLIVSAQLTLIEQRMDENALICYADSLKTIVVPKSKAATVSATEFEPGLAIPQIKSLIDLAGVYGLSQSQLQLNEVLFWMYDTGKQSLADPDRASLLISSATLHLELDATVEAGKVLAESEKMLERTGCLYPQWLLVKAEYLFSIGNCGESKNLIKRGGPWMSNGGNTKDVSKLDQSLILCRAALLASQISRHEGRLTMAVRYSRQAVKVSSGVWASFAPLLNSVIETASKGNDSSLHSITSDMDNLNLNQGQQTSTPNQQGARYWKLISVHRAVLRHAAELYSHSGLYQDAVFFAQQALKVTASMGGSILRNAVASELAFIYSQAMDKKQVLSMLHEENHAASQLGNIAHGQLLLNQGESHVNIGDFDGALKCLEDARQCLPVDSSTQADQPAPIQRQKTVRAGKPPSKCTAKTPKKQVAPPKPSKPLQTQSSNSIKRLLVRLHVLQNTLSLVRPLDTRHETVVNESNHLAPAEIVSQALMVIRQAVKTLAADPACNTVCETALALPVRYHNIRKSGQISLLNPSSTQVALDEQENEDGLIRAYDLLRMVDATRLPQLSAQMVGTLYKALSHVILLSTAASRPLNHSPLGVVLSTMRPKDTSRLREQTAILTEHETSSREQVEKWPQLDEETNAEEDFTQLVEQLPASWSVVSIGLSHDHKELLLSKINSGSSPFLMRVPLARPGIEDDEPCEFTLEFARQELVDIIHKANHSSHDARGQGDKIARKAWYTEREYLDKRLAALLANIENIWLGGFRGLLSPAHTDKALLARFGESLTQALGKHLPSRQKKSKSKPTVDLHAHVLELFTSIRFVESDADFEDSITDLLYFVVDILQFNDEANAFDEINFDALLLDTIDALRGYHSAYTTVTTQYTILIVDKELESVPWESLPCLYGHPVTRMPSLGAIFDRLPLLKPTQQTYTIPSTAPGAYILNPGSDLITTQSTLQPLLEQHLPHYTPLINTPPTEPQFLSLLTTSSILLYFGHGAGTQYIRGRTIRNLLCHLPEKRAAVTWLMGCSSAKLTEAGTYESYGVPWHYMHAGSMALVGTLWDVTDRDIDRFAVEALDRWGLVDAGGMEPKFWGRSRATAAAASAGGKGKGKVGAKGKQKADANGKKDKVSLGQAVAQARDVCNLRYLNGAAPVVYGLPVSLE